MWDLVHLIFPERSDKITYSLKIQSRPSFGSYLGRNWESLVVPTPSPPPYPRPTQECSVGVNFFSSFFPFFFFFFFPLRGGGGGVKAASPFTYDALLRVRKSRPTVERNVKFSNIARKKNFFISITLSLKIFTEMILFFISILKLILQKKNR